MKGGVDPYVFFFPLPMYCCPTLVVAKSHLQPLAACTTPPAPSPIKIDFLYRRFGSGTSGMRGRFIAQWTALIWEAIFLFVFTQMTQLGAAIAVLILFSLGVQMAEGTSYGIVPYICPEATGAVSGIVGAGGNFGAVMWGLIFRFGPESAKDVFRIMSALVLGLSCLSPLFRIRGYASIFGAARGEPDSISEI